MRIRLEGANRDELDQAEAAARRVFYVGTASRDYPNRRGAPGVRRYLDDVQVMTDARPSTSRQVPVDRCAFCRGLIRYDGRRWRHVDGSGVAGLASCVTGTTSATPGEQVSAERLPVSGVDGAGAGDRAPR